MAGSWIDIAATDGGTFKAYVAVPKAGKGPGIVVCQEIFGVNAFIREVADRYAALGYTVVAPDLFWRMEPGVQLGYTDDDRKRALDFLAKFDTDRGMDDVAATVKAMRGMLQVTDKVGVLGFCLGGRLAYLAAARAGVDCAVGYYGVGIEHHLDEVAKITVPVMLHFAGEDKLAPMDAVEKIRSACAGRPHVDIHLYPGVDHAFSRTGGMNYDAPSAQAAQERTIALFQRALASQ